MHTPTDHIEIIDHNEKILKAIIRRSHNSVLSIDKKRNSYLIFSKKGSNNGISLRCFVFAKYNGLQQKQVYKKKINLFDSSALSENITDLRSCNIYASGDSRSCTRSRNVSIVQLPGIEEKYICISFPDHPEKEPEYSEYSSELYEMLTSSAYCAVGYNQHVGRAYVVVHYTNSKDGTITENLSRFLLIYNKEFTRYKNQKGSIKRFIHDYNYLSLEKYAGKEAAHINSCKWNNCKNNLMFMEEPENRKMTNYIKFISKPYEVYTAVNSRDEVLIEFSFHNATSFYKCRSPEDYTHWQLVFLGKELTEKLQVITYATSSGSKKELTPCGMIKSKLVRKDTAKNNDPDFRSWIEHKNKLLSMHDDSFTIWRSGDIKIQTGSKSTFPQFVKFGSGYALIKPVT